MRYFPAFMDLSGQTVLLSGGGELALRKARLLLPSGARIVAHGVREGDPLAAGLGEHIVVRGEPISDASFADAPRLVIAASGDEADDERVAGLARAHGVPVNVVDRPELCDVVIPSIVSRGDLVVGISTGGAAPVVGRRLRERLEAILPQGLGEVIAFGKQRRGIVSATVPPAGRRAFWERFYAGPAAEAVMTGDLDRAEALFSENLKEKTPGHVHIVGAGPGDPELLTLKALRVCQEADVILHDNLVPDAILALCRRDAERIYVGKKRAHHALPQAEIGALMARLAQQGRRVVRLKGGDPYVFGRGSEEAIYLHAMGVGVTVVPGITAGVAGPACAGVPVTHRGVATSVTFITGHEDPTKDRAQVDYAALAGLAKRGGTLCFYMGMSRLGLIVEHLTAHGLPPDTPAAVVQWGTMPTQRHVRAPLSRLEADAKSADLGAPAIIIIGGVAGLNEPALDWFTDRPLFGRTIVVTRTRQQASALGEKLVDLGARVIEAPTIALGPPTDPTALAGAVARIGDYDWLMLTSENAVGALAEALGEAGHDARRLAGVKVAAVGSSTARVLVDRLSIAADFVPQEFSGAAMADELARQVELGGSRVLYLRADIARPATVDRLTAAGATVDEVEAYRTVKAESLPEVLWQAAGEIDWLTFASSSSAAFFAELAGDRMAELDGARIASIGPQTSATIGDLGWSVDVEADPHTVDGLIEALLAADGSAKSGGSTS